MNLSGVLAWEMHRYIFHSIGLQCMVLEVILMFVVSESDPSLLSSLPPVIFLQGDSYERLNAVRISPACQLHTYIIVGRSNAVYVTTLS